MEPAKIPNCHTIIVRFSIDSPSEDNGLATGINIPRIIHPLPKAAAAPVLGN